MTPSPQAQTAFEWPLYADATLAGLSVLFPIPLLDWLLEEYFRRRMPRAIARYRRQTLPAAVVEHLNGPRRGCLVTTLRLLIRIPIELLKRLVKKLFYILTVKEAADQLSYYWQRAFLLNYMLAAGHLATVEAAAQAQQAMEEVLNAASSPLVALAKLVVTSPLRVMRLLGGRPTAPSPQQSIFRRQWSAYQGYLESLAAQYERRYQERITQEPARETGL